MNLYIVWKDLLFLGINGLATLWSSRNIKSSKESSHLSDKQTCHLPEELLSFHTPRELLQLSRATALTPDNVVLKENCSFKLLCMWRGESIARVVMECNLVHKYPVTEGCYQQVIQPGIEVVHDPLVKYLSRISGNLWVQVTGLDKVMSQVIFQICLLLVLTSHNQDRQQIQTANPLPSVLKCTFQTSDLLGFHSSLLKYQTQSGQQDQKTDEPGPKNGKFANLMKWCLT